MDRVPGLDALGRRTSRDLCWCNFQDIGGDGANPVEKRCGHALFVSVQNVQPDPFGSRKRVGGEVQRPERTISVLVYGSESVFGIEVSGGRVFPGRQEPALELVRALTPCLIGEKG